ncbi:MAG: Modification methylase DpnIIB [Lentisphaerae bacterium ADurb.BinA184]|nr:MAG: Modification methylase DpnIIB [Lentisphaerae bacterium ADurb.BinA184]
MPSPTWQSPDGRIALYLGDCLAILPTLEDGSIDAVVTDPPYFRVVDEAWDRQWDDPAAFLTWLGRSVDEWHRLLRGNGSLYCFASPQMAGRVECEIRRRFNILNTITWEKPAGRSQACCKEELRAFFPDSERIIFAEHYGADNRAKGEAGYVAKCDELRGFVFEPVRKYLAEEMSTAGFDCAKVNKAWQEWKGGNGGMASHWFTDSQWALPTAENYAWLQSLFNDGREYSHLRREYEDLRREYGHLRREYEDLRREYEDLRRPFAVSNRVPYTDVWHYPFVNGGADKHPCEKPQAMLVDILRASTRPDAIVLDGFMGEGSMAVACVKEGRRFIGIEQSEKHFAIARARLERELAQPFLPGVQATAKREAPELFSRGAT